MDTDQTLPAAGGTPTPRTPREQRLQGCALACAAAGALLIVGSFAPWANLVAVFVGSVNRSGIQGGDGWISAALGAAMLIAGWRLWANPAGMLRHRWNVLWAGVVAGAFAGFELHDTLSKIHKANDAASGYGHASLGWGLVLIAVAAGVAILTGWVLGNTPDQPTPPAAT